MQGIKFFLKFINMKEIFYLFSEIRVELQHQISIIKHQIFEIKFKKSDFYLT